MQKIKNMLLQDWVRYGRMKDLLPFVLGAADEKARIIARKPRCGSII